MSERIGARPLHELERAAAFASRHIGPGDADVAAMLGALGVDSMAALVDQIVPGSIRTERPLTLPEARSEPAAVAALEAMAARNALAVSMVGMGYYGTRMPEVIRRNVLENPAWYTAYTPYQAEISQGRLEALLNFQQAVIDLTGMELANASLLDEATAAAEAMAMARRLSRSPADVFLVDADCHPQTRAVVQTRARALGLEVEVRDVFAEPSLEGFGVLVQYPGSSGRLRDPRPVIERVHAAGGLACVASDLMALVLVEPPGRFDADIVVGSAQRFGVPMGFGGPHAAFFATRERFQRSTPGRIIGVSVDAEGRRALRMALQTREQHIRREKATSNICTAQVLLAIIAGFYAVYHGAPGLRAIAERIHRHARIVAEGLAAAGLRVVTDHFFDTLTVEAPGAAGELLARARARGINLRPIDADRVGLSVDELTTLGHVETLLEALAGAQAAGLDAHALDAAARARIPPALERTAGFLTHPVFRCHRSETEMLRYLRRLADRDLALDRAMIPLGSCTMKLNATSEMLPVSFPGFAELHPFAPADQGAGYRQLFAELEAWLGECTGFDAVSLQPNAGSQGEFAGLLVIRAYHAARGEGQRDICLIPASAHGTNPASARMAGLHVVVVACDAEGNVDLEDLRRRAAQAGDRLAALMLTYPSTHGVFEEAVRELCEVVHAHGGQVYLDGANLNALLGLCRPGEIGADVSHINLHKTFCIPHGGGGPGMGPIGVRAHLAPYLPDHPVVPPRGPHAEGARRAVGAVSAAPWGSALILPISWAYIAMMGPDGLKRATEVALLSANYVAHRLAGHYPVLYAGRNGRVAHECIVDLRELKKTTGVTVEDVAKRLADYGFHAPTVSFPVADTLMIEPTESESKAEIDRFCDAMIAIRAEIAAIEEGRLGRDDNPLKNAPHTAAAVTAEEWRHPYSRAVAAWPAGREVEAKYWPPVARIDAVQGDRNLVCTCPPVESYADAAAD